MNDSKPPSIAAELNEGYSEVQTSEQQKNQGAGQKDEEVGYMHVDWTTLTCHWF